jgi:hypothetical protein
VHELGGGAVANENDQSERAHGTERSAESWRSFGQLVALLAPLVVSLAAVGSYVAVSIYLLSLAPKPGSPRTDQLSDIVRVSIEALTDIIEKGIYISFGLIGLVGGAILGLSAFSVRDRREAFLTAACMYFLVLSSVSGISARINIAKLITNKALAALSQNIVSIPISFQFYSLIAAIACLAWIVARRAFDQSSLSAQQGERNV